MSVRARMVALTEMTMADALADALAKQASVMPQALNGPTPEKAYHNLLTTVVALGEHVVGYDKGAVKALHAALAKVSDAARRSQPWPED